MRPTEEGGGGASAPSPYGGFAAVVRVQLSRGWPGPFPLPTPPHRSSPSSPLPSPPPNSRLNRFPLPSSGPPSPGPRESTLPVDPLSSSPPSSSSSERLPREGLSPLLTRPEGVASFPFERVGPTLRTTWARRSVRPRRKDGWRNSQREAGSMAAVDWTLGGRGGRGEWGEARKGPGQESTYLWKPATRE